MAIRFTECAPSCMQLHMCLLKESSCAFPSVISHGGGLYGAVASASRASWMCVIIVLVYHIIYSMYTLASTCRYPATSLPRPHLPPHPNPPAPRRGWDKILMLTGRRKPEQICWLIWYSYDICVYTCMQIHTHTHRHPLLSSAGHGLPVPPTGGVSPRTRRTSADAYGFVW